jgi:NitT/TauT family transport system permease protein
MTAISGEVNRPSRTDPAGTQGQTPIHGGRPSRLRRYKRSLMALARVLLIAVVFLIWWGAGAVHLLNPLIFPSIGDTVHQFATVLGNGTLISNSLFTLETAAIGFAIGMVSGTVIGFFVGLSSTWTGILAPFITVLNVLPRIALAPLYVLWFGIGSASGIALVVSLVFFTALLNTISGTRAVEPSHMTIARLYGAGRRDIIQKVVLPATVPWIITAGRLSLAHALAGAIIAEMFLGQQGLGYLIAQGSGVFNMGVVFAAIFASLIIAVIAAWLGDLLENHLLRWRVSNIST